MRQAEGRVDVARISPKADEGGLLGDAPAVGGGRGVAAVTTIGTDTRRVKQVERVRRSATVKRIYGSNNVALDQ